MEVYIAPSFFTNNKKPLLTTKIQLVTDNTSFKKNPIGALLTTKISVSNHHNFMLV